MVGQTLLILDDDRSFVEAVSLFLSDHGYRTLQAFSGREAIRQFGSNGVDLAIIDVNLPDISGIEVTKEFGQAASPPPVIMISSDHRAELQRQSLAAGARMFLPKPIAPESLLASIATILSACSRRARA